MEVLYCRESYSSGGISHGTHNINHRYQNGIILVRNIKSIRTHKMFILVYLLCGLAFIPELFNEKR